MFVYVGLLALERLGGVALALLEDARADVDVQFPVVVDPEPVREEVVDDPLRRFKMSELRIL